MCQGPFFLGPSLSLVDIHLAPFALRLRTILQPRRGYSIQITEHMDSERAIMASRWQKWLDALTKDPHIQSTTSTDDLYADTADILIKWPAPVPLGR